MKYYLYKLSKRILRNFVSIECPDNDNECLIW